MTMTLAGGLRQVASVPVPPAYSAVVKAKLKRDREAYQPFWSHRSAAVGPGPREADVRGRGSGGG
jgi:hypothetical protein